MNHLAQMNIARLLAPLDHPMIKDFNEGITYINSLAESSPGFVWRIIDEESAYEGFSYRIDNDDIIIFTFSIWENIESLKNFTYGSDHRNYYKRKKEWFHNMADHNYVLWWIKKDHRPSITETISRLRYLNKMGESAKSIYI